MKCFIHNERDSVAICLQCGKAMCIDCSSFSDHSGVCPVCRRTDLQGNMRGIKTGNIGLGILAIILLAGACVLAYFWEMLALPIGTVVVMVIFVPIFVMRHNKYKGIDKQVSFLKGSLTRGNKDLLASGSSTDNPAK